MVQAPYFSRSKGGFNLYRKGFKQRIKQLLKGQNYGKRKYGGKCWRIFDYLPAPNALEAFLKIALRIKDSNSFFDPLALLIPQLNKVVINIYSLPRCLEAMSNSGIYQCHSWFSLIKKSIFKTVQSAQSRQIKARPSQPDFSS